MKPMAIILAMSALSLFTMACTVREERVVARPATTEVVTPAPGAVVYTDPAPVAQTTVTTIR
jgi:hypothetical protein